MRTDLVLWHRSLGIVADISGDTNTDEHEDPDDEIVVASPLHALVADPWFLIPDVVLVKFGGGDGVASF